MLKSTQCLILLSIALVCVNSFPEGSIEGVSVNVGPDLPTFQKGIVHWMRYKRPQATGDDLFLLCSDGGNNDLTIYDPQGSQKARTDGAHRCRSLVLFDNLKLFTSSRADARRVIIFTVTKNQESGEYSLSIAAEPSGNHHGASSARIEDTSYVVASSTGGYYKVDVDAASEVTSASFTNSNYEEIDSVNISEDLMVICKVNAAITFARTSDLGLVKQLSLPLSNYRNYKIDSQDPHRLFYTVLGKDIYVSDISSSSTTAPVVLAQYDFSGKGGANTIHDLASIGYVTMIPSNLDRSCILLFAKANLQSMGVYDLPIENQQIIESSVSQEVFTTGSSNHFALVSSNNNFQSYIFKFGEPEAPQPPPEDLTPVNGVEAPTRPAHIQPPVTKIVGGAKFVFTVYKLAKLYRLKWDKGTSDLKSAVILKLHELYVKPSDLESIEASLKEKGVNLRRDTWHTETDFIKSTRKDAEATLYRLLVTKFARTVDAKTADTIYNDLIRCRNSVNFYKLKVPVVAYKSKYLIQRTQILAVYCDPKKKSENIEFFVHRSTGRANFDEFPGPKEMTQISKVIETNLLKESENYLSAK